MVYPSFVAPEEWLDHSFEPLKILAFLLYCFWVYETCVSLRGFQSPVFSQRLGNSGGLPFSSLPIMRKKSWDHSLRA